MINSVPVRPDGIVDYDSRPEHNRPLVAPHAGSHIELRGVAEIPERFRTRTDLRTHSEVVFSIEPNSDDH